MTNTPRILLVGCGPTSLTALESLVAARFSIVGVFRDTAEAEREADAVTQVSQAKNIPLHFDASPTRIEAEVRRSGPDCVVVSSYNRILPPDILKGCKFINVHYAHLPRYRGRACVNWAVINGETHTAITIHELVADLDAGPVLFQQLVPIGEMDTVTDLYARLNRLQREHLGTTVGAYLKGASGTVQVEADASYGCTRLPEDGEIQWSASTRETHRLIRALTAPFPGAYTYVHGRRLQIWRAEPVRDARRYDGRIPGRVVAIDKKSGFVDILTGDGVLRLLEVQLESDDKCPPATVINSVRTTLGLRTDHLLARIALLEKSLSALTVRRLDLLQQDGTSSDKHHANDDAGASTMTEGGVSDVR